ncbi:hypothetical protein [Actinacidiphila acidipaludis]|uniref:Uncharacterized protein n=1 Tax=Actinacidiphila acidipaludis TaxID=2873382 RepID=A0ABS7QHI0_9ACTN|nr:hypothetical protein [Streptomyces acidipaludis]MBY8882613.1 hypothetical protein [Streptomyces acidipaludis]
MTALVKAAGYTWPWRVEGELGPWLFVLTAGLLLGCGVSAAASGELNGPWPAFAFGIGAPATIRGLLSGVEVSPRANASADEPVPCGPVSAAVPTPRAQPATEGENVREDAR